MRRYVWFRNLTNKEALARVGPQRHKNSLSNKKEYLSFITDGVMSGHNEVLLAS
jgi:hypothetical protein